MAHYTLASKNISGEIIHDELIIIDLAQGVYFTSKGAALYLWKAIVFGSEVAEVIDQLSKKADDPVGFIKKSETWINALTSHGIIKKEIGQGTPVSADWLKSEHLTNIVPPTYEMHQDLEDILLFDPVHDVDGLGWPKPPMR